MNNPESVTLPYNLENLGHHIGNPLFALETNLNILENRIKTKSPKNNEQIFRDMEISIERIKEMLENYQLAAQLEIDNKNRRQNGLKRLLKKYKSKGA